MSERLPQNCDRNYFDYMVSTRRHELETASINLYIAEENLREALADRSAYRIQQTINHERKSRTSS